MSVVLLLAKDVIEAGDNAPRMLFRRTEFLRNLISANEADVG